MYSLIPLFGGIIWLVEFLWGQNPAVLPMLAPDSASFFLGLFNAWIMGMSHDISLCYFPVWCLAFFRYFLGLVARSQLYSQILLAVSDYQSPGRGLPVMGRTGTWCWRALSFWRW